MRLIVTKNDGTENCCRFSEGPIGIGRKVSSRIFLPDVSVSRRHAKIFLEDQKWFVEDLGSANKTYLNEKAIHKARLKTSDVLQIGIFNIEVDLEDSEEIALKQQSDQNEETLDLEAMLSTPKDEVVVRKPDGQHAPAMRLPAKRLSEFSQAAEILCQAANLDELVHSLLDVTLKQFTALNVWCGLRSQLSGPITYHAGKRRDGKAVELADLKLNERITQALERGRSMVLPQVAASLEETARIRSALIAVIQCPKGNYGVIYADNSMLHKHYCLSDLDYLMFVAMHTAAILGKYL